MSKKQFNYEPKAYLGTFSYGATGEGYRVYACYFTVQFNQDPQWIFFEKLNQKWAGGSISFDHLKSSYEFCSHGIRLYDMDKNDWFESASKDINRYLSPEYFKMISELHDKKGLVNEDFEFFSQYNLS